ncbi:flavodoxin family protein [Maridesulfovibrio bastinii]|uniref:flavodoxin family protein n=1 Tax=Maridesulfovibrio bastinii TaxID=47157 RepID=UPI0003FF2486|nr:flavodoxin family protein [Maridesulfovibrio bastinii]
MKVVAFNGSPRKGGNTEHLLKKVLETIEAAGIETELVHIGGKKVHGCMACQKCFENKDGKCSIDNDFVNECIEKMVEADGIILGSPTYFANVSTEIKALIDRAGYVTLANGALLKRKVGAAVVAVRRGGGTQVYDSINRLFGISQMFTAGSTYWNIGYGLNPGEVENDNEAMQNMVNLGENMVWFLQKTAQK